MTMDVDAKADVKTDVDMKVLVIAITTILDVDSVIVTAVPSFGLSYCYSSAVMDAEIPVVIIQETTTAAGLLLFFFSSAAAVETIVVKSISLQKSRGFNPSAFFHNYASS